MRGTHANALLSLNEHALAVAALNLAAPAIDLAIFKVAASRNFEKMTTLLWRDYGL